MHDDDKARRFREVTLPHLNAAFNLARWLTRNDDQAQDIVQEAYLRAYRYFDGFRGGDARAWLLKIVRHRCYDWLQKDRARPEMPATDTATDPEGTDLPAARAAAPATDPETLLIRRQDAELLNALIERLPAEFREVLILREIENLSYREIAGIAGIPEGTVMSRLSRARGLLRTAWGRRHRGEACGDGL